MKRAITFGSLGLLCVVVMGCNEDPTGPPSGSSGTVSGYWSLVTLSSAGGGTPTYTGCTGDFAILEGLTVHDVGGWCLGGNNPPLYTLELQERYIQQGVSRDCKLLSGDDPFDYGVPPHGAHVLGTQGGGGTREGFNLDGQMDMAAADWTASDHYTGVKSGASELQLAVNQVSGFGSVSGQCRIEPPLGLAMKVSADSMEAGSGWYSPSTGAVATVLGRR